MQDGPVESGYRGPLTPQIGNLDTTDLVAVLADHAADGIERDYIAEAVATDAV